MNSTAIFAPAVLSQKQAELCMKTVSSNTFYMLVGDALMSGRDLSVVRMGDGEVELMQRMENKNPTAVVDSHSNEWLNQMGCHGIMRAVLRQRLQVAAEEATYFCPSISGIQLEGFNVYSLFRPRDFYIDNFWCNAWTEEMKIQLFQAAKHVLFIHRNRASANAMQIRAKYGLGVRVTFLELGTWQDTERVIEQASAIDAPLTIFSAGPAGKYIGPRISRGGRIPKVVLDIGNAADYWLLSSLKGVMRA